MLNSLAGDKLKASLRCVARHGKFLEIGKYDLFNDTELGMGIFLKNISFHGILLDSLFKENSYEWKKVADCLTKGMKDGVVKPLQSTVFNRNDVENAFRFMAQGKHIGKVLLTVSYNTI